MSVEATRELGWSGAFVPARTTLVGGRVRLEPLDPPRHGPALFAAFEAPPRDGELWRYLAYGPFADEADYVAWLWRQATALDPVFYTVVPAGAAPAGVAAYLRLDPPHGVIEIGHLVFAPRLQRTAAATEALFLLLGYAFDRLGYRRVEWKADVHNARSRRAAERLGFTCEGVFRQSKVAKDRNRDTAWYAMLDREWPERRAALEAWLAPANVDGEGRRRRPLEALRGGPSRERPA